MAGAVTITSTSRYIYVSRADGSLLSRHLTVEDAIEAAVNAGLGEYRIQYPDRKVVVSKVYGTLPAASAPTAPTALTLEEVTAGYASLSWTDDGNGTSWTVYRDGAPLGNVAVAYYTDSTVVPSTGYTYQVQASNSSGSSTLSDALAVTTSANSLPDWSLTDQSGTIGAAFSLNLNTVCSDADDHTLAFTLTSGSVPGLSLTSPNYTGTPTTAGAYPLTFRANDGYGTSDVSITFNVYDPDVTAPTVPTSVSANATGSTVTVTWTSSTDATGVAHYRIYRNGSFRATATASPYVESGVPVGSYSYTVSAVDSSANANESAQSSAAPVTVVPQTPDTPINFTATSDGATTINLSWAAGPNGPAPDDYDLDFSATSASGPWTAIPFVGTATTYAHTGRTAGTTYYYRVRARLGASESGYAAAASGVVTVIPAVTSSRTFDASNASTGFAGVAWPNGRPTAGHVLELAPGTHGALTFSNLVGTAGNRITVRNASGGGVIVRKQTHSPTYGGFVWVFNNSRYFTVDGSNGMADGQCGIKVTYSADSQLGTGNQSNNDRLAAYIKMSGYTLDYTLKRIEVDGGYAPRTRTTHYSTAGSGILCNDDSLQRLTGSYAGRWIENIRITECYIHGVCNGAFYVGKNWSSNGLPLRNIEIDNNVVRDTAQDGFTCKAWMGGVNSIHHNDVQYTGMDPRADGTYESYEGLTTGSVNQRVGFSLFDGYADIYNNKVRDVGRRLSVTPAAHGFTVASVSLTNAEQTIVTPGDDYSLTFPFTSRVYNNVVSRCDDRGIRFAASSTNAPAYVIYSYCNTLVDNELASQSSGGNMTGFVKNNIMAGNGTDAPSGPLTNGVGSEANLTNASATALLTNPTGDDYTLLAAQLAGGTVGSPPTHEIPFSDFVGTVRVNGTADKGAYEKI